MVSDILLNLAGYEAIIGKSVSLFVGDETDARACCVIGQDHSPQEMAAMEAAEDVVDVVVDEVVDEPEEHPQQYTHPGYAHYGGQHQYQKPNKHPQWAQPSYQPSYQQP